jgi:hypothetical protein
MNSGRFDAESFAHRTFEVEDVKELLTLEKAVLTADMLGYVRRLQC